MRKFLLAILLVLPLSGCFEIDYYLSAVTGHLQILSKRQSIQELLQEKSTPAELQLRLNQIREIRDFASQQLDLPNNGSYRSYVKLDRPYAVWNVVATPEFSLTPKQWCFPIAGCVSYRGYFKLDQAKKFAQGLANEHYDTAILGAPAYSTLKWFDDPVLSTFSNWPLPSIANLIFHELAHQLLYVQNDSTFNESFANSVGQIGVERWLESRNDPKMTELYQQQQIRQRQFQKLQETTRGELLELYASSLPPAEMRSAKQAIFDRMKERYARLKDSWQGYSGYDGWFSLVNNARFASSNTYNRWVPAFKLVFAQEKNDLPNFYRRCRIIAELPSEQRNQLLATLTAKAEKNGEMAASRK